jgi:hypothetical protein
MGPIAPRLIRPASISAAMGSREQPTVSRGPFLHGGLRIDEEPESLGIPFKWQKDCSYRSRQDPFQLHVADTGLPCRASGIQNVLPAWWSVRSTVNTPQQFRRASGAYPNSQQPQANSAPREMLPLMAATLEKGQKKA